MTFRRRRFFLLVIYILLLAAGWLATDWTTQFMGIESQTQHGPTAHIIVISIALIFVLASAIPFVPGAEIGFGLIMVFGGRIALLVYLSMVVALILAFVIGRHVPPSRIAATLRYLGFRKAQKIVMKLAPLDSNQRMALLTENAPKKFIPHLLQHRYLALILLFNMPGNATLGGGGGIAFSAGLSGLFSYAGYVTVVIIGVAPVPLFFWLFR